MIHEEHKAFARAVVALAREHGMDNIALTFRFGYDKAFAPGVGDSDPVHATWSTGRHGADGKISMESKSFQSIGEHAAKEQQ